MSKKNYKFYLKVHQKSESKVVSVCDSDLINKKFESKDMDLEISERFYKGELVDEEVVLNYLRNEKNFNLVGKNIIEVCLREGIINKKDIIKVEDIPIVYILVI